MSDDLICWKCGASAAGEPMPLSREARCRTCEADLHACRQCRWYDPSKAKSCAEPVADEVRDKERANFCGYFAPAANPHAANDEAEAARRRLEDMFGLGEGASPAGGAPDADALAQRRRREADAARSELDKLFGLDED